MQKDFCSALLAPTKQDINVVRFLSSGFALFLRPRTLEDGERLLKSDTTSNATKIETSPSVVNLKQLVHFIQALSAFLSNLNTKMRNKGAVDSNAVELLLRECIQCSFDKPLFEALRSKLALPRVKQLYCALLSTVLSFLFEADNTLSMSGLQPSAVRCVRVLNMFVSDASELFFLAWIESVSLLVIFLNMCSNLIVNGCCLLVTSLIYSCCEM